MKNLTLVIPVKNETESLPKFLKEVMKMKYNVMLVIDSKDKNSYNLISPIKQIENKCSYLCYFFSI